MPRSSKNILILYTRLADYFYQGLRHLVNTEGANVLVVAQAPDPNAPYKFATSTQLRIENETGWTSQKVLEVARTFQPDLIYIAGWGDVRYRKVGTVYCKKGVPVVVGLDNPWKNTMCQRAFALLGRRRLKRFASHLWVAGSPQYAFASRLGFEQSEILTGLYCANTDPFKSARVKAGPKLPKKLLFLGRFVEYKHPVELAKAFLSLDQGLTAEWSLHFIGRGPQQKELEKLVGPQLEVHDFIPPHELPEKLTQFGIFCLPSDQEHWGVVVHEAAAAGLPLLLSDTVAAADAFLITGYNGFLFQTGNPSALKKALQQFLQMDTDGLETMGHNSMTLADTWDYKRWAAKLMSPLDQQ